MYTGWTLRKGNEKKMLTGYEPDLKCEIRFLCFFESEKKCLNDKSIPTLSLTHLTVDHLV